jgi:hypothetical protein
MKNSLAMNIYGLVLESCMIHRSRRFQTMASSANSLTANDSPTISKTAVRVVGLILLLCSYFSLRSLSRHTSVLVSNALKLRIVILKVRIY